MMLLQHGCSALQPEAAVQFVGPPVLCCPWAALVIAKTHAPSFVITNWKACMCSLS